MEHGDVKRFFDEFLTKFTVREKLELIDKELGEAIKENRTKDAELLRIFFDLFNDRDKQAGDRLQQLSQASGEEEKADILELAARGLYYQKIGKKEQDSVQVKKSILYFTKAKENIHNIGYLFYSIAKSNRILGLLSFDDNDIKEFYSLCKEAMAESEKAAKEIDNSTNKQLALSYVYNQLGNIYLDRHEFIGAEEKFIASNNEYENAYAHNGLGSLYRIKGKFKEAMKEHKLSLEYFKYEKNKHDNDKECMYPLNYIGDCYRYMEDYGNAEEKYIEAIHVNKQNPYPWHGLGRVFYELGNRKNNNTEYYSIAKEYFIIALNLDSNFKYGNYSYAKVIEKLERDDVALNHYEIAKKKYPKSQFVEQKIQMCIDNINKRKKISDEIRKINDVKDAILLPEEKIIVETIGKKIQDSVMAKKDSFSQIFLRPKYVTNDSSVDNDMENIFEINILRRWNSYTPIITDGSKGGGYFIKAFGKGIVIDPGFSFINNFKEAGYIFADIDKILISHAHDDHTADLESILNLLYRYNKLLWEVKIPKQLSRSTSVREEQESREKLEGEKENRYKEYMKRLKLYVSENVLVKYNPYFKNKITYTVNGVKADGQNSIDKKDEEKKNNKSVERPNLIECDVNVIKPNSSVNEANGSKDINITAIESKHNDIFGKNGAIGFRIDIDDMVLIYTGDTGWSKDLEKQYKTIRQECEWKKYVVLLAHIGGFKEMESDILEIIDVNELHVKGRKNIGLEPENQDNYLYDDHLGRIGLVKINRALKPNICIISEFGEEFKGFRVQLTEIFSEAFKGSENRTIFIPADIGLKFDILKRKVKAISKIDRENRKIMYEYIDPECVKVGEYLKSNMLFYYKGNEEITENDCLQALAEGFKEEQDETCMIYKHKYFLKLFYDGIKLAEDKTSTKNI